ncbi:alanine--tRNA ligase [Anaeromyxobacter sp. Fw109-5]|uniref:Alanine--tRNA ligase n=1 Tax=Anaeromyxobacter sp. (strain Fw109-5) TaxID=404589 RepID=SYA_ANADF|nr:alanine--tRNA ligase [Anaeromyxobacter sp. Fw109-5]A7HH87.1 RecName: Full=Alanine--tRNA ligase; AltName: Full=Alanyl-tRNA synthetase; Short=AlaRS [Anaeromyxobacter sp. Fw109-5]ABS28083.1 alanyl-tRNA synthetase [Anaeromyxobacter sp. Fw109-5]
MKTAAQIRELFLRFFEEKAHRRVPSSSLVPQNDPTLLFTNAGMNQFKDVFTGREKRDYSRATTAQKCVRAGGKHNDLENVGFTARHHTFFEMLGNFSFGDYFKKEAIAWAWELVTSERWLAISKERLAATVFAGEGTLPWDEEAYRLWEAQGVPPERIHKLGAKDNFWAMGDTGPCGPCSELHFFQGNDIPCAEEKAGRTCQGVACDCDRWLEIWNLVFMQFERGADGGLTPLPKPSIDTGAGLERMAAVVQGKRSNYDIDAFQSIIRAIEKLAGKRYGATDADDDVSMRVIADHARATTFLVGDGVLPANEGRGYVLRRIMRRAIRHGKRLGLERPFLADVCEAVMEEMGGAYPETRENRAFIVKVAGQEEESFRRTLDKGLAILETEMRKAIPPETHLGKPATPPPSAPRPVIDGKLAFQLYDTFGFPLDLTRVIAAERGFDVDEQGFDRNMAEQRARSEWKGSGEQAVGDLHKQIASELGETRFLGYEAPTARAEVKALLANGARAAKAARGDKVEVVTAATPFYGESGGQVGDQGSIAAPGGRVRVEDTRRPVPGLVTHVGVVEEGELAVGDLVELAVDDRRRDLIRANHSATHLLQLALRETLGDHVKQAGSIVAPDYLRFDFSHFQPLSEEELNAIERRVNELVRENAETETAVLKLEDARQSGAMMIFGEKYGDVVRVVRLGPSKELCGGTHVRRTGDIAFFKIGSEESIAAGVRRIVAYTGPQAIELSQREADELRRAAALFKAGAFEVAQKIEQTQKRVKDLERALDEAKGKIASAQSGDLAAQARDVKGAKVLAVRVQGDGKSLRELADKLRDRLGTGVVALGAEQDGKAILLVAVTKDLTARLKAGELVKEAAKLVGGSGGGKPDLAQAGGSDPAGLEKALAKVQELAVAALG